MARAEKYLRGIAEPTALPPIDFKFPFDEADLQKGTSAWQLQFASLVIPETLLRAYETTGREEFLMGARDVILGLASYERRTWLPKGFLWNDHAVAARVPVLAEFWRLYRHNARYDAESARNILQFAARSGSMLAKPRQFTFRTNHGIMQNIALLHLCVAFPGLPGTEGREQVALNRLDDQMRFYINDEGVVLEHSVGYHAFGLRLFGIALRYFTLLNQRIPDGWAEKYEQAKGVYSELRRPDGTLPAFGDTDAGSDRLGPIAATLTPSRSTGPLQYQTWLPKEQCMLYPVAGYAVWWRGLELLPSSNWQSLSQTAITWSYFPNHGHKHADETSVSLWAAGQNWLTNTGYWPYWMDGRKQVESWQGSNAPHLIDEPGNSARTNRLVSSTWSTHLAAVITERHGPGTYVVRRQIFFAEPNLWMVVDNTEGDESKPTTTTWTIDHNVRVRRDGASGVYRFETSDKGPTLRAFFWDRRV